MTAGPYIFAVLLFFFGTVLRGRTKKNNSGVQQKNTSFFSFGETKQANTATDKRADEGSGTLATIGLMLQASGVLIAAVALFLQTTS